MFIHLVLFKIKKHHVAVYMRDCRLWRKEAARHKGFLACHTLFRTNQKDHYASFYAWRSEGDHRRFMDRHHDRLVSLSGCPVEVVGYFNFNTQKPRRGR